MILRYLLNDNKEMADEAEKIIKKGSALVSIEVVAEVVYVLQGVYSIEREKIKLCLLDFMLEVQPIEAIPESLPVFDEKKLRKISNDDYEQME